MTAVGADQYIPDDIGDNSLGFSQSPGGDLENQMNAGFGHGQGQQQQSPSSQQQQAMMMKQSGGGVTQGGPQSGNGGQGQDMTESQKLQLAERANEIYRQQLKYMQDHLASLRSLIQDKENIIENLMLRYDLGIITQDQNRTGGNLSTDEMEMEELRRKAEALAQRTILENFELREMVNELRDENFHLRNEIYELQDKINRQVLQINKLEKHTQSLQNAAAANAVNAVSQQSQSIGTSPPPGPYPDDPNDDDIYDDVEEEQYVEDDAAANNAGSHNRYGSITGNDWLNDQTDQQPSRAAGRRQSTQMDPANTEEALAKRSERASRERKESVAVPDLFGDGQGDSESDTNPAMTDEAQRIRAERANKTRKESVVTPDIYGDQQGDSEEDEQPTGTKRRDSQIYMDEEARRKREQRRNHRRGSSVATPNIFSDRYDPDKHAAAQEAKNSEEAIKKRLTRRAKKVAQAAVSHVKKHRRKESLAEKLLLGFDEQDDQDIDLKSADPEQRRQIQEKARKEQRRKSRQLIKQQVGDKLHYSDEDVDDEKPQRGGLKARKKLKSSKKESKQGMDATMDPLQDFDPNNPPPRNNKKRKSFKAEPNSLATEQEQPRHRRDSSNPIPDLGFDDSEIKFSDPEVVLHLEKLRVKDLQDEVKRQETQINEMKQENESYAGLMENKTKEVSKAMNDANIARKEAETVRKELDNAQKEAKMTEKQLESAIRSKADLAAKCSVEIMRLTMILNTLQQMPKLKEVVALLMEETNKDSQKNGSLLD